MSKVGRGEKIAGFTGFNTLSQQPRRAKAGFNRLWKVAHQLRPHPAQTARRQHAH
jgi:hypothetical protein